jgi:hypothetical protein
MCERYAPIKSPQATRRGGVGERYAPIKVGERYAPIKVGERYAPIKMGG